MMRSRWQLIGWGALWAMAACGTEEVATCTSDEACGAGSVCRYQLCVRAPAPEVLLTADQRQIRMGENVRVVATAGEELGPLVWSFRVEPEGSASVTADRATAWVRPRMAHTDLTVIATARTAAGHEGEGQLVLRSRNSEPVVSLAVEPDPFQPGDVVVLQANAADPDGDQPTFSWSLESGVGRLEADGASARLVTEPGVEAARYGVRVDADDGRGGRGSAALELQPRNAAPAVRFPPVEVEHRCAGEPLRCEASAELVVEIEDAGPVTRTFRLLDEREEVRHRFRETEAGTTALDLWCEPACALAGDWVVEVKATDALGASRVERGVVTVTNRPPVLRAHDGTPVAHRAVLVGGQLRYVVTREPGTVLIWDDPDGDPPAPGSIRWSSPSEAVSFDDPETLDPLVRIEGSRSDLLGVELVVIAADINGAEAADRAFLEVGNRPPTVSFGGDTSAGHRYLRSETDGTRIYRKSISLDALEMGDPDGDPLDLRLELDPDDPATRGRIVRLLREQGGWELEGVGPSFVGANYRVIAHVTDPWGAEARSVGEVRVTNRPPTIIAMPNASTVLPLGQSCREESCCIAHPTGGCAISGSGWVATAWDGQAGPLRLTAQLRAVDPDGDPVVLQVGVASSTAASASIREGTSWVRSSQAACHPAAGSWSCPVDVRMVGQVQLGISATEVCLLPAGTPLGAQAQFEARADDGLGGVSAPARWSYVTARDPQDRSCP